MLKMTNREWILSSTPEELALFLTNFSLDTIVLEWFGRNYCDKCQPYKRTKRSVSFPYHAKEVSVAPCELGDNPCGYANCDLDVIVQLWLRAEHENLKDS